VTKVSCLHAIRHFKRGKAEELVRVDCLGPKFFSVLNSVKGNIKSEYTVVY